MLIVVGKGLTGDIYYRVGLPHHY